jgi:hypothetical protein
MTKHKPLKPEICLQKLAKGHFSRFQIKLKPPVFFSGAIYNIIRVPPTRTMPENPKETLEGATVVCSIPSVDKARPSYYHSFGEQTTQSLQRLHS